jgi:hypothetical protein
LCIECHWIVPPYAAIRRGFGDSGCLMASLAWRPE